MTALELTDSGLDRLRASFDRLAKLARKVNRPEPTAVILETKHSENADGSITRRHTTLYQFTDTAGNAIIWYTNAFDGEIGKVYSGIATIKDHREYHGQKQTVITRAKLTEKTPC